MFCSNCGQANPDDSKFCVNCGAALENAAENEIEQISEGVNEEQIPEQVLTPAEPASVSEGASGELAKAPLTTKIILGVIAAVIVILVIGLISAFGIFKHGSVKVLEKNMQAMIKGDGKTLYATEVDPYRLENALDNEYYDDEEEYIEEYIDRAEQQKEYLEDRYGDKLKASFEVRKVTKYDRDDIEELDDWLSDNYDYYPEGALKNVRVIKVRAVIEGTDDTDRDTNDMIAVKIGRKWYVSSIFYSKNQIEEIIDD